jgi:hypothetical protein
MTGKVHRPARDFVGKIWKTRSITVSPVGAVVSYARSQDGIQAEYRTSYFPRRVFPKQADRLFAYALSQPARVVAYGDTMCYWIGETGDPVYIDVPAGTRITPAVGGMTGDLGDPHVAALAYDKTLPGERY